MPLPVTKRGNLVYRPDGKVLEGYFWDRSKLSVIQGPIGCLSAETEFLSRDGWVRIDAWAGHDVLVWSEGRSWFERPEAYVDLPCDEMWRFSNAHSLSMVLSDEHRVPLYDRDGRFCVRVASDVAASPGRYVVPTTFEVGGSFHLSEVQLRLLVALSADGCFPKKGGRVVVTVRKERKKVRLRELLSAAGVEWREHQHSTRPTELSFSIERHSWMTKTMDWWAAPSVLLEAVIDEVPHWDGLFEGADCRYSTTDQGNADFIQFAAHATGRRATISRRVDDRGNMWKPLFTVHISHKESAKSKVCIRGDSIGIERVPSPDGRKYCFTTSTGFFLARHNGRVFVTGNSGTSSASCMRIWVQACEQAPDFDGVRRSRWIVTRDTYKELRETTIKTWLEWFPENDWGVFIRSEPMVHDLRQYSGGSWELRDHPSGDGTKVDCQVIFLAVPDADVAEAVLASYEITGFFRNEGQFCEKAVIDELLSRCSRYPSMKNGPGATWFGGIIDLNAPIEGHWIPYMRGDMDLPADMSADERSEFEKPDDWTFYVQPPGLLETRGKDGKIVYQPNPAAENQKNLRETYLEKIKGKTKEWIDRRVLNKVGLYMEGKPVYPSFMESEHVHERDQQPFDGVTITVGLDFGREPAACFGQQINGHWIVLSELIGENESAEKFAPRVKRHLAQHYPSFTAEFYGDPRGADGTQATETTAYSVFMSHGMRVLPATTDNNTEMRRSTFDAVLDRRNGFKVNAKCLVLKRGLAGGYCYRPVKGFPGVYQEKPAKNHYSHIVEACENMLLGGGEGFAVVNGPANMRRKPSAVQRPRLKFRSRF